MKAVKVSDLHLKIISALGTAYRVLSLAFGQSEHFLAYRAFSVAVGLSVAEFQLLYAEKAFHLVSAIEIYRVFRTALFGASGENPVIQPYKQCDLQQVYYCASEENIYDDECEPCGKAES